MSDVKDKKVADDAETNFKVLDFENVKPDLRKKEMPLVDLKVTNPITYIKSWWKKIIGNEGIELKIKAKPLTVIAITIIILTVTMGVGRIILPFKIPFFEYRTQDVPILQQVVAPIKNEPRDTAFAGVLKFDVVKNKFFLFTANSEAINLTVPENLNLIQYIGRRIFAAGKYDEEGRTLLVETASDMEILPTKYVPIPTLTPFPEVTSTPLM